MTPGIIAIDIETENTGYDIRKDNKRIISIQLLERSNAKIYYEGGSSVDLIAAKNKLFSLIRDGSNFLGFNIKEFDVPLIREFLGVEIPTTQIIEITEIPAMEFVRQELQRNKPRLEEACKLLGIDCAHKEIMTERAGKFRQLPHVINKAKEGASKFQNERGWDYVFSFDYALDKICGGMAILEAFNEFVERKGDITSDFYKYAIGDVKIENELFLKLKEIEKRNSFP